MGFKIFKAVRKQRLALYIKPVSPLKETLRLPLVTSCAPRFFNSSAKTSSKPKKVLAIISKFVFITPKVTKIRPILFFEHKKPGNLIVAGRPYQYAYLYQSLTILKT